jgi:hypothetical protein
MIVIILKKYLSKSTKIMLFNFHTIKYEKTKQGKEKIKNQCESTRVSIIDM